MLSMTIFRIEFQDRTQTEELLSRIIHHTTQPEPRKLTVGIQAHRLAKETSSYPPLTCPCCSYPSLVEPMGLLLVRFDRRFTRCHRV